MFYPYEDREDTKLYFSRLNNYEIIMPFHRFPKPLDWLLSFTKRHILILYHTSSVFTYDLMIFVSWQRGETALHMAARAGQVEVVRCLLRNGALVDARARVGAGARGSLLLCAWVPSLRENAILHFLDLEMPLIVNESIISILFQAEKGIVS